MHAPRTPRGARPVLSEWHRSTAAPSRERAAQPGRRPSSSRKRPHRPSAAVPRKTMRKKPGNEARPPGNRRADEAGYAADRPGSVGARMEGREREGRARDAKASMKVANDRVRVRGQESGSRGEHADCREQNAEHDHQRKVAAGQRRRPPRCGDQRRTHQQGERRRQRPSRRTRGSGRDVDAHGHALPAPVILPRREAAGHGRAAMAASPIVGHRVAQDFVPVADDEWLPRRPDRRSVPPSVSCTLPV